MLGGREFVRCRGAGVSSSLIACGSTATDEPLGPATITGSLLRGELVPEIEQLETASTPNNHYTCGACAAWSSLEASQAQELIDAFFAAPLPDGFKQDSHIIHTVEATSIVSELPADSPTVDVLEHCTARRGCGTSEPRRCKRPAPRCCRRRRPRRYRRAPPPNYRTPWQPPGWPTKTLCHARLS